MNQELVKIELETLTNEELVKLIQTTNEVYYWEELDKRTKRLYSYALREYVHPYYKETMREDIISILKQGWVKAVNKYDEEKATADFIAFCSKLMEQAYVQFARRITEKKSGVSVRDEVMSSVTIDGHENSDKMTQGCIDNIMKYEVEDYRDIEIKDYVRDMLNRLKKHDKLQYIIIKQHCIDGITQKDLGRILNMSQSAISRHIRKGLRFLEKEMKSEPIW